MHNWTKSMAQEFYTRNSHIFKSVEEAEAAMNDAVDMIHSGGHMTDLAREADYVKARQFVEDMYCNICGGRHVLGQVMRCLVDDCADREAELRQMAERRGWDEAKFNAELVLTHEALALQSAYILFMSMAGTNCENPIVTFKNREKRGDFEPLGENEDPSNLRAGRRPMDDAAFEAAKRDVLELGQYWDGKPEADLWEMFLEFMQ